LKTQTQIKNTLANLLKGEHAVIDAFTDEVMSLKLLDLGCTPGSAVSLVRKAPLGDPIAVNVSGQTISMRMDEASTILISLVTKKK
jgi:ferrous iron transport protein A